METSTQILNGVTGYSSLGGLDPFFELAQRSAIMLLSFSVKTYKILLYTYEQDGQIRVNQIDSSELAVLKQLLKKVLHNSKAKQSISITTASWNQRMSQIYIDFEKRSTEGEQISAMIDHICQVGDSVVKKIASMRKEKTISL